MVDRVYQIEGNKQYGRVYRTLIPRNLLGALSHESNVLKQQIAPYRSSGGISPSSKPPERLTCP
jgi:hypothetical protein